MSNARSHIVASFVAGARIGSVLGRAKTLPLGSVNNYSNTYSCWCEPKFLACGGVHHIKQDIWLQPFSRHHLVAGHLVAVLISCRTLLCYFILGRAGEVETPPRKRLNWLTLPDTNHNLLMTHDRRWFTIAIVTAERYYCGSVYCCNRYVLFEIKPTLPYGNPRYRWV